MLDTYSGRESETLEVLKIYPMKTLAFEEKTDEATFEEYDADSMTVKVNMWRPGLTSLSEEALKPSYLKIKKTLTMEDFQRRIAEQHAIEEHQNIVVLKKNPMLNNMRQLEVVSDAPSKQLNQLRINEGVNLFIEDKSVPYRFTGTQFQHQGPSVLNPEATNLQQEQTKWETEFELESNRFTIRFNDPVENAKA